MRSSRFLAYVLVSLLSWTTFAHAEGESPLSMGAALMVSPWAGVDTISDGHGPIAEGAQAIGLNGEIAYALNSYLGIGLGLRYTLIPLDQITDELAHEISVPLLFVGAVELGAGKAVEGMFGFGYTTTLYSGFTNSTTSGGVLRSSGASGEVLLGYVHALSPRMAVTAHTGVRAAFLQMDNGDSYWQNSTNFIGELVVRAGLRFR